MLFSNTPVSSPTLFQVLPLDIIRNIWSFDSTYHEIYRKVLKELQITWMFNHRMADLILNHHHRQTFLNNIRRDDLLAYYETTRGHPPSANLRRLTKRRILAVLLCSELQRRDQIVTDDDGLWLIL